MTRRFWFTGNSLRKILVYCEKTPLDFGLLWKVTDRFFLARKKCWLGQAAFWAQRIFVVFYLYPTYLRTYLLVNSFWLFSLYVLRTLCVWISVRFVPTFVPLSALEFSVYVNECLSVWECHLLSFVKQTNINLHWGMIISVRQQQVVDSTVNILSLSFTVGPGISYFVWIETATRSTSTF